MPIYEYQCSSCGQKKEVLQKLSDAPLKECPACGKPTLNKLISAAGFQLKGSGWYVTDFRGGNKAAAKSGTDDGDKKSADGAKADASATPAAPAAESKPKEEAKSTTTTGSGTGSAGE